MIVSGARPCVLVFAGLDPSGGAGLSADLQAVTGQGAHALTVCTALTVQDNDRVYGVQPVDAGMVLRQAQALVDKCAISAVKIGITGSAANAQAIAEVIMRLRERQAELPVVLDPVLASGHGDVLSRDDAVTSLAPLLPLATVITPNGPEAQAFSNATRPDARVLSDTTRPDVPAFSDTRWPDVPAFSDTRWPDVPAFSDATQPDAQARFLRARGCRHVLITGGHGDGDEVVNRWYGPGADVSLAIAPPPTDAAQAIAARSSATADEQARTIDRWYGLGADPSLANALPPVIVLPREWRWGRLAGEFHGSGCTLASAIAGQLAMGVPIAVALENAQLYTYHALRDAYAIAHGQRIPLR